MKIKQLSVTEGAELKLSAKWFSFDATLPDNAAFSVLFTQGQLKVGSILFTSETPVSFTWAQVKAGLVSFIHDGGGIPPSLQFSISGASEAMATTSASIRFTSTDDGPVLTLGSFFFSPGRTTAVSESTFSVSDEDTEDPGQLLVKLSAVKGGKFLLNGQSCSSFTMADLDNGLLSFQSSTGPVSFKVQAISGKVASPLLAVSGIIDTNLESTTQSEFALKQLSMTEGQLLKLGIAQLNLNPQLQATAKSSPATLEFVIDNLRHADILVSGVSSDRFTYADLKAGKVALQHDGGELAPQLQLSLVDHGSSTAAFIYTAVDDLPTLALRPIILSPGSTTLLNADTLLASDPETAAEQEGGFWFTVKSAKGVSFSKDGMVLSAFSLADVMTGQISVTRSQATTPASYSLSVTDLTGKTSKPTLGFVFENHLPTGALSVSGDAIQGAKLKALNQLVDADGLGALSFTWEDSDGAVLGHTASLSLSQEQVGKQVRLLATYTDGNGSHETASSAWSSSIANINDLPIGNLNLQGLAKQGQTIEAVKNFTDIDGISGEIHFDWYSETGALLGSGSSLHLGAEHVGIRIRAAAIYTDDQHGSNTISSALSEVVETANHIATGSINITGLAVTGGQLRAVQHIIDEDGIGQLLLQWQDQDGHILGTGDTLAMTEAFSGKRILVKASYLDGAGNTEHFESASLTSASSSSTNDFRVNSVTNYPQSHPSITSMADGGYMVAWSGYGDGKFYSQRFDSSGLPVAGEFIVNNFSNDAGAELHRLALSGAPDGSCWVTWLGNRPAHSELLLFMEKIGADGQVGPEFRVPSVPGAYLFTGQYPAVTTLSNGDFVIGSIQWRYSVSPAQTVVALQFFHSDGTRNGDAVMLAPTMNPLYVQFKALSDGRTLVAWTDSNVYGLHAQILDAEHKPVGAVINVPQPQFLDQENPDIISLANGDIVFVWGEPSGDIMSWRVGADGQSNSEPSRVNQVTDYTQRDPQATILSDGSYIVTWTSDREDGSSDGVILRHFHADGTPMGDDVVVNTITDNYQNQPDITVLANGGYVVTWAGYNGIFARQFGTPEYQNALWQCADSPDNVTSNKNGNDTVLGIGHDDSINTFGGDDRLQLNDSGFRFIDSGSGVDCLVLNFDLNLHSIADKTHNIEVIELGTGVTMTMNATDFLSVTDSSHTLKITGAIGARIDLDDGWTQVDTQAGFTRFTQADAVLLVQVDLTVV